MQCKDRASVVHQSITGVANGSGFLRSRSAITARVDADSIAICRINKRVRRLARRLFRQPRQMRVDTSRVSFKSEVLLSIGPMGVGYPRWLLLLRSRHQSRFHVFLCRWQLDLDLLRRRVVRRNAGIPLRSDHRAGVNAGKHD